MCGPDSVLLLSAEKNRNVHVGILNPKAKKESTMFGKVTIKTVFGMRCIHCAGGDDSVKFLPDRVVKQNKRTVDGDWTLASKVGLSEEFGGRFLGF